MGPGTAVVGYAVALGEGGIIGHLLTAVELTLLGVNGVDVGLALLEVTDGVPYWAVNAYSCQALGAGEDDVALSIIPCIVLVLLEYGELDGVNHLQVF